MIGIIFPITVQQYIWGFFLITTKENIKDCPCTVKLNSFTVDTTSPTLSFVLTGSEYSRMATKRITMKRRRSPMNRHLNLRHTMNFMVLHGLVNQKKEVSGRLVLENERFQCLKTCWLLQIKALH